jgi:phage terminase small subunit
MTVSTCRRSAAWTTVPTALLEGNRLMSSVRIMIRSACLPGVRVEELLGEAAERCGVTVDRIVQELAKIGFANSRDFFEWDQDGVRIKASAELTPDQTAVVVEVQETRSKGTGKNTIKIKLSDKQAALEKLGRHLGMFKETNKADLAGPDGKPLKAERTVIILPSNGREAS